MRIDPNSFKGVIMKFIVYLMTMLFVGSAIAQNPTILQGSYISNVFGNSNFVLNPNAQTNIANVTTVTATVARSTSTPLVATSQFTVAIGTANGTATWATRAFDAGMKGQNCEARFTYRGFAATSKVHIKQGANTVASLNLTPATDPRIASINFPCGDLSTATTFQVTDTAILAGTNEIGGIYVGLATNMANVAQAELIGTLRNYGTNCIWTGAGTSAMPADTDCSTYTKEGLDLAPTTRVPAITFTAPRSGNYAIGVQVYAGAPSVLTYQCQIYQNGVLKNNVQSNYTSTGASQNENRAYVQFNADLTSGTAYTFDVRCTTSTLLISRSIEESLYWMVHRFPSSSELVVTPERQNWYVSASHTGANPNLGLVDVTTKTEIIDAGLTLTPDTSSQPVATLCSATNAPPSLSTSATTCAAGSESLGITFNIPSTGAYEVCAQFASNTVGNAASGIDMAFSIEETATNANTALTSNKANARFSRAGSSDINTAMPFQQCNNILFSSIGQKAVRLMYQQGITTTVLTNIILADNTRSRAVAWTVRPLANQSNSALYVQGPVKAAISNTAIPTDSIGGKVIDASLAKTTTALGTWQVAAGNFGTPPAGSYLMIMNSVGTAAAGIAGSGSIINENGSSVTPVVCQLNSINSTANDSVYGRVCYYTTDGTKTLFAWAQAVGANTTVTTGLILVRLN